MANILVNPGTTTAVATIDIGGGVESPRVNLINQAGASIYGIAGTPNGTSVIAVQGVSGGVSLPISVNAINGFIPNLGSGTGGTGTLRTIIDSSQLSPLGQTTSGSSQPVVIASDQSAVPVSISAGTAIIQYALPANSVSGAVGALTNTALTTLLSAPGSGQRNYLTQLLVTNAHATTSSVVIIGDGTVGTTMTQGYAVAAGGGFSISFPQPLRQPTLNTALVCYCVTTGSSVYVSTSGYKGV